MRYTKAMQLGIEEVKKLANLAKLELSASELEDFSVQLGDILAYVAKLKELSLVSGGVAGVESKMKLRMDEVNNWQDPARLVGEAPEHESGLVKVPPVFSEREN